MQLRRVTSTIVIEIRKEIEVDYVIDLDDAELVNDATAKLTNQVNRYRRALGDKECYGAGTVRTPIPFDLIEGATARVWTGGYQVGPVENKRG